MELSPKQRFNEALLTLGTVLYQIDGKVSLSEIDYIDELVPLSEWESPLDKIGVQNAIIHKCREAIDCNQAVELVRSLKDDLMFDADKALEVAKHVVAADDVLQDEELEILAFLENRLLVGRKDVA